MPVPPVCVASPPVGSGLKLLLVTVAKKLSHAAIVALGNTTLDCVVPLPTKIALWPGSTGAASDATSPPTTDTFVPLVPVELVELVPVVLVVVETTSPVWLFPRTKSRRKTHACAGC